MPRINLAQYFPERSAPRTPGISQHALDAEFQAGRNVAGAAAELAGAVGEIDRKITDANEAADRRLLEINLRTGLDNYASELAEKHDEVDVDKWADGWDAKFDKIVADGTPKKLSSSGHREMKMMIEGLKIQSAGFVTRTARAKRADVAGKKFGLVLEEAIDSGNETAARNAIAEMKQRNIISDERAKSLESESIRKIEKLNDIKDIGLDGSGAWDVMQRLKSGYGSYNPEERRAMIARAERENLSYGAKILDGWNAEYALTGEWPTPDVMYEHVDKGRISKKEAAEMRVEWERNATRDSDGKHKSMINFLTALSEYKPRLANGEVNARGAIEVRAAMAGLTGKNKSGTIEKGSLYDIAINMVIDKENPTSSFNRNPAWNEVRQYLSTSFNSGLFGEFRNQKIPLVDPITGKQLTQPKMRDAWDSKSGKTIKVPALDKDGKPVMEPSWETETTPDGQERWKLAVDGKKEAEAAEKYMNFLTASEQFYKNNPDASPAEWRKKFQDDIQKIEQAEIRKIQEKIAADAAAKASEARGTIFRDSLMPRSWATPQYLSSK